MISLDLTKSSEVRKAGDQPKCNSNDANVLKNNYWQYNGIFLQTKNKIVLLIKLSFYVT